MTSIRLQVDHFVTDADDADLHYEIEVTCFPDQRCILVGRLRRLPADSYSIEVARVPRDAGVRLLTPDARLSLQHVPESEA